MPAPLRTLAAALGVAALAALSATGCASLDQWQRRAIFQHEASARWSEIAAPDGGIDFDLAVPGGGVTGADTVHAWYLAPATPQAPTVLYLHGARRNLYGNAGRIERLRALGIGVLAVDYRGFGRSTAILPSEDSAIEDATLAFAELQRREPDPARRFVYGYSLGGAVAIALAERADGIAGVVVEASFTSIPDLVRSTRWGWVPFVGVAVTQKFDSLARIAHVSEPLLFIHGTADRVVPHTMSDRLYAAAGRVPPRHKRVLKVEGATHWGAMSWSPDEFGRVLAEFMRAAADGIADGDGGRATASTATAVSSAAATAAAAALAR